MSEKAQPGQGLKWIAGIGASASSLVPGISFFTEHAPPIFEVSAFFTTGVSVAVLLWVFSRKRPEARVGRGVASVLTGLALIVFYWVALKYTTVLPPQGRSGERWQCGFHKAEWSLTEKGRELKRERPTATPQEMMMMVTAFRDKGPDIIWKTWSIVTAGLILVLLFFSGFVLWVYGFAELALMAPESEPTSEKE